MQDVYIISAVRTPIGRYGGALLQTSPVDLAAHVMKAALERAGIDGSVLDFFIFGNILKHGHGQLLPRQAALKAGIPNTVDGYALDMLCSSGMMSVMNGASMIKAGEVDLALVGGVESMSQAGFYIPYQARYGLGLSALKAPLEFKDVMLTDGLTDPMTGELMGEETDRLVKAYGVSRQELDEVAYLSHHRAAEATAKGCFAREIAPIEVKKQKGSELLEKDEGIRPDTTPESLAKLRPAFGEHGCLTAGNSSQISDGAAALVLANGKAVDAYKLTPIARIRGSAWAAGESWRFAEAPLPAIGKLLKKLDRTIDEVDLFENNEAFALNSVLFKKELEIPYDKLNIYGGAIALGHPVGCSGARIMVTLLNALRARGEKFGLASLCHGTGGGTAVAVELVAQERI